MASGAGELSAEADQLKEAVAFFRADQVGQATGAPKPSMKAGRSASKPALRVVRPAQGFGFDLSDADDGLDAGFQRSVTG
ncbi:chemotaxis protein [Rhodobacter sphaeroides]|nr:chemotaxis protein [Cereibacter sphaeroides]